MKEKQNIIKLFWEGVSQREIAKRTNKSRNTINKYIRSYEESKQVDIRNLPISEDVVKIPTYKKRTGKKKVLTEEIKQILGGYINENDRYV